MRTLRLSTVAAGCALGTVICFVLGAVAMSSSGVGVLIPETGRPGRDWIAAVDRAGLVVLRWGLVGHLDGVSGDRRAGGFLRHPPIGWAGDDSGSSSRRRRVDAGDCLAPDPNRDGLRTSVGLHRGRPGRTGHAGGHCRHPRRRRPCDQRCRQFPKLGCGRSAVRGGHPYHPRATAVDRMAWPARRGARWMVGATQPGIVGDLEYLQHRLHRLLRFHAEHGHRSAPAPLKS
jgi:hypothetical protein